MQELSRTQKKKKDRELQQLGEKLVALTAEQLNALPLPEELAEAVVEAKNIQSHSAKRRQMQYIGVLMRNCDPEPIAAAMARLSYGRREKVRGFKQVENWRDALIAGDDHLLERLLIIHLSLDREELTALVSRARKEAKGLSSSKSGRPLFRYLMAAVQKELPP